MRYQLCYPRQYWEQFNQPIVRDIAWMFFSPTIVTENKTHKHILLNMVKRHTFKKIVNWLVELDQQPEQNTMLILDRNAFKRLGLYCEALFEIITTLGYKQGAFDQILIDRNIQIFKPNTRITLGELDFLARDTAKNIRHIEMATKFYLLDNSHKGFYTNTPLDKISSSFVGPNRADRLDIKLKRLNTHQLPIAHTATTFAQLSSQNIIKQPIQLPSQLFLKGMLFCYFQTALPINAGVFLYNNTLWAHKPQHMHAITQCEKNITQQETSRWQVLKKLDWFAGPKASDTLLKSAYSKDELSQLINKQSGLEFTAPILLQQYIALNGKVTKGVSLMIVSAAWPCFDKNKE